MYQNQGMDFNDAGQQQVGELIPAGTIAKVVITILSQGARLAETKAEAQSGTGQNIIGNIVSRLSELPQVKTLQEAGKLFVRQDENSLEIEQRDLSPELVKVTFVISIPNPTFKTESRGITIVRRDFRRAEDRDPYPFRATSEFRDRPAGFR